MEKVEIEIPAIVLRSAYQCQCKDKYRHNIKGIYLENTGWVVATNGHLLYRALCDFKIKDSLLLRLQNIPPKNALNARINFLNESLGYVSFTIGKGYRSKTQRIMFDYEKTKEYPDYRKAIKSNGVFLRSGFLINSNYISLIEKIFPHDNSGVSVEFNDESYITIKPLNIRDVKEEDLTIMGMHDRASKFTVQHLK
jgi:hypothetical protein